MTLQRLLLLLLLKAVHEECPGYVLCRRMKGLSQSKAPSSFGHLLPPHETHEESRNLSTQFPKHCSSFLLNDDEIPPVIHLSKHISVNF